MPSYQLFISSHFRSIVRHNARWNAVHISSVIHFKNRQNQTRFLLLLK